MIFKACLVTLIITKRNTKVRLMQLKERKVLGAIVAYPQVSNSFF